MHRGANKGLEWKEGKRNWDLWSRFWELKRAREETGDKVEVLKVKAHAELPHIYMGVLTMEQFKGNCLADAFAGEGAKLEAATHEDTERIRKIDDLAWKVQERIVATSLRAMQKEEQLSNKEQKKLRRKANAAKKKAKAKKPKTREARIEAEELRLDTEMAILRSKHLWQKRLTRKRTKWKCTKCLATVSQGELANWLNTSCVADKKGKGQGSC